MSYPSSQADAYHVRQHSLTLTSIPTAAAGVKYGSANVLADPELREGIKKFTSWPTIPQASSVFIWLFSPIDRFQMTLRAMCALLSSLAHCFNSGRRRYAVLMGERLLQGRHSYPLHPPIPFLYTDH